MLNKRGRLELKSGNRFQKLFSIFASPDSARAQRLLRALDLRLPEPDHRALVMTSRQQKPVSLITGEDTKVEGYELGRQPGWCNQYGHLDPLVEKVRKKAEDKIKFEFEQTFMFYLPSYL